MNEWVKKKEKKLKICEAKERSATKSYKRNFKKIEHARENSNKMKLELRNMLEIHVNKTWREMCNKREFL